MDDDENVIVKCDPKDVGSVRDALTEAGFAPKRVEIRRVPQSTVEVDDDKQESFGT